MSTQTTFPTSDLFSTVNQSATQLREWGEQAAGTGRALGQLALENYERAVASLVDAEHQAAESTDIEWIKAAVGAHADLVQQVNGAYIKAARAALV